MSHKVDVINLLQNEKYHKTVSVPEFADRTEKFTVYKILLQVLRLEIFQKEPVYEF